MNRACFTKNANMYDQNQHASSIRPLKINFERMKDSFKYFVILTLIVLVPACDTNKNPVYKDPHANTEDRIKDLMKRMTLEEKIAQLSEATCNNLKEVSQATASGFSFDSYKNGIGTVDGFTLSVRQYANAVNVIQNYLLNKTRLGIPAIFLSECLHGLVQNGATIYPQSISMASSWDPELVWLAGCHIRKEVRATGISQVLSPDLDLARELRWGRVEETYGEDPYLASKMGVAMIKGLQEGNEPDSLYLIATAKPFLTYSAPYGGLNLASTPGGWYDIYNTYLPPYKAAIEEAGVLCIMSAYNSYNGEALNASSELYTDLLRTRLGFKGYVYSDWGAVTMLNSFHKVAGSRAEAAKLAIEAGIDLEAPSPQCYRYLDSLVQNNVVRLKTIDQAVRRILYVKFKSGLFEHPFVDLTKIENNIHTLKSIDVSKKLADESIVLLKNANNLLPLDPGKIKSIAIIGPNADQVQFGDYTWSRDNKDGITVLEGMKKLAGDKIRINYAKGCDLTSLNAAGIEEAVKAAKKSDIAVVVIGTASASLARDYSNCTSGEGYDLSDLNPTGLQEELVKKIYTTGTPTIIVLIQGKPFSIPWMKENIPAIIEAWYPGESGGTSIAEIIFGKINPSGRLPVSFPKSVGHLPCFYNYLPTDKGYYKKPGEYGKPGRDYVFSSPDALWPFGYGLSYTKFTYENMTLSSDTLKADDSLKVTVRVKNSGERAGKEVVQLYIRDEYCSIVRPIKELKAFKKVSIDPGEIKQVELEIKMKNCGYYNNKGKYLLEPGTFNIMVGSNSDNILLNKKIYLKF
jgi:beta-glucosidase